MLLTQQHIDEHCSSLNIARGSIEEFTIPDGVTEIDQRAFELYYSLETITIPDSVKKIGSGAFSSCSSITSITIPDSVTKIDSLTFLGCASLRSINIPDSVTEIGYGAFVGCTSLKSINLPDSVTEIDYMAFRLCTSLTSITIPDSVTRIMRTAFEDCTSLMHIICNNSCSFTDVNVDQTKFISSTDYFKEIYKDLSRTIKPSGFNSNHVSFKELNLIMKLHQEDFLPDWETLANTFNERSIDQIASILKYFNKTCNVLCTKKTIVFHQKDGEHMCLNGISMFLNPKEHTKLYMTAKDIIANTPIQEQESTLESEQEQDQPLVALFNRLIV